MHQVNQGQRRPSAKSDSLQKFKLFATSCHAIQMTNPYKRMYVITEDEYMQYKRLKDRNPLEAVAVDGKVFAHGFSCNLCRQVFKTAVALDIHLKQHAPQVQTQ